MSTHSISRLLLPALLLTPFALPAQTVMNIDFGRNDNQTAENWNNVTGSGGILDTPSVALIDDGGNPTGITLVTSFAGGGSFAGLGADFAGPYPAPFDTAPAQARADSLFKRGASVTFTLTGLIPGEVYELVIYGARGNNGGLSQFTVTDDTGVLPVQSFLNYNNATETATFSGLVPDSNDEITIVFEGVIDAGSTGNNDNERTNGAIKNEVGRNMHQVCFTF